MQVDSLGEIIARRSLTRDSEDGCVREVEVLVGKPQGSPGADDWYCPFQITGLGSDGIRFVVGVDSIQAVQLAFRYIGTLLARVQGLKWLGRDVLGFPLSASE